VRSPQCSQHTHRTHTQIPTQEYTMKLVSNGKHPEANKPVLEDEVWYCQLCKGKSVSRGGIYKHYFNNHGGGKSLFSLNKVKKPRKQVQADSRAKKKLQHSPRYDLRKPLPGKQPDYRPIADDSKVNQRGGYNTLHSSLQVKTSKQPDGGDGVFSKEDFLEHDILTTYVGVHSPVNLGGKYCLELLDKKGFIHGSGCLKKGEGMGSKINRTNVGQHANVKFMQRERRNKPVIVEVVATKNILSGSELLVHYGNTYPRNC
jgi:hypothetical protein